MGLGAGVTTVSEKRTGRAHPTTPTHALRKESARAPLLLTQGPRTPPSPRVHDGTSRRRGCLSPSLYLSLPLSFFFFFLLEVRRDAPRPEIRRAPRGGSGWTPFPRGAPIHPARAGHPILIP